MRSLRFLLLTGLLVSASMASNAQIFFTENFEGAMNATTDLPASWTETGLSTDGIWSTGDATAASSPYLTYPAAIQGTNFAYTNDDACNCDKSADRMILPAQNFTGMVGVELIFDVFLPGTYGGTGTVEVSTDGGATWTTELTIATNAAWQDDVTVGLNSYAGNANVLISFVYNDNAAWADGIGVDEVRLNELTVSAPDASLVGINAQEYTIVPFTQVTPINFSGDVDNIGTQTATNATLTVNVYDAATPTTPIQTTSSAATSINAGASATLTAGSFTPTATGNYVFEYIVNTTGDLNTNNDTLYAALLVDDFTYARDDANITASFGIGAGSEGFIGSLYTINTATPLDSVFVAYNKPGSDNAPGDAIGDSTRVAIFSLTAGTPNTMIGMSDVYVFTAADTSGLITRTFAVNAVGGGTLSLAPGTYLVAAVEYNTNMGLAFADNIMTTNTVWLSWNTQPWTAVEAFPPQFQKVPIIRPILGCALSYTDAVTDATCTGGNGSATVTASGIAPYTYNWSNGNTTATANNLTAGDYFITITDALGCALTDTVTVGSNTVVLAATNTTTNSACGGATGSASVNPTNGTAPYNYTWSNNGNTQTISNIAAGSYTVTISDANGCEGVISGIVVNNPNSPTSNAAVSSNFNGADVSCNGASDGEATVTASGGTAPYNYAWSSGGSGATESNLAAGVYTVTVTDNASCSSISSITITEPTEVTITGAATTNLSCFGAGDGAIDITVAGGTVTSGYTFNWSDGSITEDLTGLSPGGYTGTVTDNNGCFTTATASITEPLPLSGSATQTDVACNAAADGTATANISGGTAPYGYSWSDGQTTMMASGLGAGSYSVTITDDNGCLFTPNSVTVTEPAAISAGVTVTDASTAGGTDGAVDMAPAGGTPPYSFSWDNGANTEDLTGVAAGTYSVTITDANGCTHVASGTVADGPTSITLNNEDILVNLFPNPAKDQAVLSIELQEVTDVNIEVVNVTGQVMHRILDGEVLNAQYQLDMNQWAAGVYFVRLTVGEETQTYRLIKQ